MDRFSSPGPFIKACSDEVANFKSKVDELNLQHYDVECDFNQKQDYCIIRINTFNKDRSWFCDTITRCEKDTDFKRLVLVLRSERRKILHLEQILTPRES